MKLFWRILLPLVFPPATAAQTSALCPVVESIPKWGMT